MIHFTNEGIFADTEEERLTFYDRMHQGDPVIWGHIQLWQRELQLSEEKEDNKWKTTSYPH